MYDFATRGAQSIQKYIFRNREGSFGGIIEDPIGLNLNIIVIF